MTNVSRAIALRLLFACLMSACAGGAGLHAQQTPAVVHAGGDAPAAPTAAPSIEARFDRQRTAVERALFASDESLPFTLIADFKAVQRDRSPESTRTYPATLVVAGRNGKEDRLPVHIRSRGHSRRLAVTCTFPPIRIEFRGGTDGTIFQGHKSLKLGTHCRDVDSYEQYVYREYLVYKVFNHITAKSFRARLATGTYVDAASGQPVAARAALFLEDDDDVARRLGGETTKLRGMTFAHVDSESMALLSLFEYMIGNTDMSLVQLHNIILVRAATGVVYPVPYDFDYSGLVNARYAVPATSLNLPTVRERLYRGPCLTAERLSPLLARLQGMRDAIAALYDLVPPLDPAYRKDARSYLDQFFRLIARPAEVKRTFIDGCDRRGTM